MGMTNTLRIVASVSVVSLVSICLAQGVDPGQPGQPGPDVRVVRVVPGTAGAADAPTTQPKELSPMERLARPDPHRPSRGADCQRCHGPGGAPMVRRPTTQPVAAASRPDTTAGVPMPDRAFLRLKLGWYESGEKDLRELLKADETKLSAAVALSELYRRTGRYEQSGKVLDEVAALGAKSADWRCEKAELLATLGKYEQALALAQSVLAEDAVTRAARWLTGEQLATIGRVPRLWAESVVAEPDLHLHARWLAGQQLETLGRIPEAIAAYKVVDDLFNRTPPRDAVNRTWAGLCLDRYSRLISKPVAYGTRIMQDFYQEAYEVIDRQYWPARIASANLATAASKVSMGREDFSQALKINPNAYEAYLGVARTLLEEFNFDKVDELVGRAKKINAKDPAVLEVEAALHMAERNYPAAAKSAQAGLDVNPRHIGLLGLLAAANLRQGDQKRVDELTAAAEAINPKPAEFFATLAEWEAAARQYDSAEKLFKKAIDQAPWDPNPMGSLGMMYMQTGQEDLANKMLDKAFAVDAYNFRSKNVLDLLDKMVGFSTITSEHFIIRYNKTAEAIIGPYFRDYLEGIYAELSRDYDTKLDRRVTIEVFPKHDDFSMRVTGRSWIPTVGACTGWVIALYSPHDLVGQKNPQTGDPLGFNWARVLRHEFTHVVTLAATENRIPHWFTECLAVTQEHNPPQWKWINMLAQAVRQNELFDVDKIDWGFIRPKAPTDREKAYAQSEWMGQFIVAQYGYPTINKLLRAFHDHKTQGQAFKDVLGLTEGEFDQAFRAWARKQVVEEWRLPADRILTVDQAAKVAASQPQDAKAKADLAVAYAYARKPKEAEQAAREALALDSKQTAALEILGVVLEKTKWAEAKEYLVQLADLDEKVATAPRLLAQHAAREEQWEMAIFWFNRLKLANQHDPVSYDGLAAIYLKLGDEAKAQTELAELARREQTNPVYALQLARISSSLGKFDESVYWLNEALHFNPFDPATHEKLAKSYLALRQPDKAVSELTAAIELKPGEESYWTRLAFVYDSMKKTALARKAAEMAVKLRPESPAQELLGGAPPSTQPEAHGRPLATPAAPAVNPTSKPDERDTFFD